MKLKSFIGLCISCTAIAVMAAAVHAETYALGGSDGHADGSEQDTSGNVSVPVVVSPDAEDNGSADVNGYIMTFTYNPKQATPVSGTDENSPYATEGEAFADGIIVSADQTISDTEHKLIVAWAAASPVTVTEEATPMANVKFHIEDTSLASVPVQVALKQVANSNTDVKTEEQLEQQVVHTGEIDLAKFIYGDVDGNGEADAEDASRILQFRADLLTEEELISKYAYAMQAGDVNANGEVDSEDASYILQFRADLLGSDPFPIGK